MQQYIFLFLGLICFSCQPNSPRNEETNQPKANSQKVALRTQSVQQDSLKPKGKPHYSWLKEGEYKLEQCLVNQIAAPKGYQRVAVEAGSFAEWLRFLPLEPKNQKVLLYNGQEKPYQKGAERVVKIDIGKSDLQQCADAIMRLKAEYHYSKQAYSAIHFNYTSGHKVAFEDWSKGKKPQISGNKVSFSAPNGSVDTSYPNFKKYLNSIFMYAGTASLEKEMQPIARKELAIGDVFIKGGFPGHAVLIVDMVEEKESGKKLFLLVQSYMPAQSIHILKNFSHNAALSPWYPIEFGEELHTPEWDFAGNASKRFKD